MNGNWGNWGNYGSCSVTCGDGEKSRTRTCDSPPPSAGGAPCSGKNRETTHCKDKDCPGNDIQFNILVTTINYLIQKLITKLFYSEW